MFASQLLVTGDDGRADDVSDGLDQEGLQGSAGGGGRDDVAIDIGHDEQIGVEGDHDVPLECKLGVKVAAGRSAMVQDQDPLRLTADGYSSGVGERGERDAVLAEEVVPLAGQAVHHGIRAGLDDARDGIGVADDLGQHVGQLLLFVVL